MGWADLLARDASVVAPWTGGRELRSSGRTWRIVGALPPEHGWQLFAVGGGRDARWKGPVEADPTEILGGRPIVRGYLVGDRLFADGSAVVVDPARLSAQGETVFLLERGLDRFARIRAARAEDGRLVYLGPEFPLGPEEAVARAYEDEAADVDGIPGVTPALDLAFRFESHERTERRLRRERLALEQQRRELLALTGDGASRRDLAKIDFEAAARAALAVGGAELLDHRDGYEPGTAVVRYRFENRRFECVCDRGTLRIVEAGICLNDYESGESGDTRFTLESLPGVVAQAIREQRLVVFRHVDEEEP